MQYLMCMGLGIGVLAILLVATLGLVFGVGQALEWLHDLGVPVLNVLLWGLAFAGVTGVTFLFLVVSHDLGCQIIQLFKH